MSKFFRLAASSSESSESEESDDEVRVQPARPAVRDFAYPSDDSDDEAPKRVVRAQKDKMYEALKEQIHIARKARNIRDFTKLLTAFENLGRAYEKAKTTIARENLTIPRFYIRFLAEIEDFVNEQWKEADAKKKKGLPVLRQKVRKYNKDFETELEKYRSDPDPLDYSSGAAEEDDEALDEQPEAAPLPAAKKAPKKVTQKDAGAESDQESWASDTDDESSESDIDLETMEKEKLRQFFLKKTKTRDETKPKPEHRVRRQPKEKVQKEEGDEDDEGEWRTVTAKHDPNKPLFEKDAEITVNVVSEKLAEIIAQRGRKKTDRKLFVRHLNELYTLSEANNLGVGVLAKILFALVTSLFEMDSKITEAMDFAAWQKTLEALDGFIDLLIKNPNVYVSINITEEDENLSDPEKPYYLHGSMILQVKRLDDQLTKIFQQSDCHSTDYLEKLKGEKKLCDLIEKAQSYVDSRVDLKYFDIDELATIYMLRIEHLYYKYSPDAENQKLMDQLCKKIYSLKNAMLQRQRALLCQIYHHALHDRWDEAKQLLHMSYIQSIIDRSEASTQILYNRAICQLGLCAFRHGRIKEAHQALSEIQNTQRPKELLAQGVAMRQLDRTPEQETRERSLQVPYHMHINLEVMECVYLICSMLLEIPNIACHEFDLRRRLLSRSFHYQLKFSERAPLIGPPENTREHVVAASRAMLNGDWRKCRDYIINEKMNTKVWNLFRDSEKVKNMVRERIQKEALRTYLLMYCTVYTTVSIDTLHELFELDPQTIHSLVSKMIIQEELSATLDEPTNCITMHRVEPSRLQLLALNLTDKLNQLAEYNEQQLSEPRGRNYAGPGNWNFQRGGADRGGPDDKGGRRTNYQGDRRGNDHRFQQDGQRKHWTGGRQQNDRPRGMRRY